MCAAISRTTSAVSNTDLSVKMQRPVSTKELRTLEEALTSLSLHPQDLDRSQALTSLSLGNKYTLHQVLGSGLSGVALYVTNALGQSFVIKVARNASHNASILKESVALDSAHRLAPEHTVRKVEIEEHLNLSDCGHGACCNDRAALVTVYGGNNLCKEYLESPIQIPVTDFISLAHSCMEFLRQLSAEGMVLRDIKPENIIISKQRLLRFIDFHFYGQQGSPAPWYGGTKWYRSPAMLTGKLDASEMSFALGCVLFEILTGKPLFKTPKDTPLNPLYSTFKEQVKISCMHAYLTAVFTVTGSPHLTFGASFDSEVRDLFFTHDPSSDTLYPRGSPISAETVDMRRKTLSLDIFQAISPLSGHPRILLEGVDQKLFREHFLNLLFKLLNFENPPKPEDTLAHPFFKLKQGPQ